MSATGELENTYVEQRPTEAQAAEQPEKQETEKKPAKEKKTQAPKEKRPKNPKPRTASHPPYLEMIKEGLSDLNKKSGSSPYAIAKYMEEKYKAVLPANFRKILGIQLKNSAARGKLIKIKASYKLSEVTSGAKKLAKKQPNENPGKGEKTKRSAITDVSSPKEAEEEEEEDIVEKNLKPYIYVSRRHKNEKRKPEEEEAHAALAFGYEFGSGVRRQTVNEEKEIGPDDFENNTYDFKGYLPYGGKVKRMTTELWEKWKRYFRQVHESQGFDLDIENFPGCGPLARICPFLQIEGNKWLNDLCRKALSKINSLNGTHCRFVKVLKANRKACALIFLFITFQARNPHSNSLVTFQARAYRHINPRKSRVECCRLKKDTRGPMGSN